MPKDKKSGIGNQLLIISLLQCVIYSGIWLWNEYVASYLTIIFPIMILLILILSAIADWIEPSGIPGWYYKLIVISILIPLLIGTIFYVLDEGKMDWLENLK